MKIAWKIINPLTGRVSVSLLVGVVMALSACSDGGTNSANAVSSDPPVGAMAASASAHASASASPAAKASVTKSTGHGHGHSHDHHDDSVPAVMLKNSAGVTASPAGPALSGTREMIVYKSPTCGCCSKWVKHLEAAGFTVKTEDHRNMSPIKHQLGVPGALQSCHTAKIGNYVIEGHVPAGDILRLMANQSRVAGLAVPGMPKGSPGMEHPRPEDYATIAFQKDGSRRTFAEHGADGKVRYSDAF